MGQEWGEIQVENLQLALPTHLPGMCPTLVLLLLPARSLPCPRPLLYPSGMPDSRRTSRTSSKGFKLEKTPSLWGIRISAPTVWLPAWALKWLLDLCNLGPPIAKATLPSNKIFSKSFQEPWVNSEQGLCQVMIC